MWLRGRREGMKGVHNLSLSFPFPPHTILSHVSTGCIIFWEGSGRGIWVLFAHERGDVPNPVANVFFFSFFFWEFGPLVVFSRLSTLTQITGDPTSRRRELPPASSAMSRNNAPVRRPPRCTLSFPRPPSPPPPPVMIN